MKLRYLYIVVLLVISCKPRYAQYEDEMSGRNLKKLLADTAHKVVYTGNLINNKQTAIDIAEPILFKTYGEDNIIKERPYSVELIDGDWVLSGRLPDGWMGGAFFIVLSAKDGKVLRLTHGK